MTRTPTISLVPTAVDLALYAGDGARLGIIVRDTAGEAVVLDGTVAAQIRAQRPDPVALEAFQVDIVDADAGSVVLSLTGEQTAGLLNGDAKFEGAWDVQWTPAGEQPLTVVQGKVTCVLDVTRG